MKPGYANNYLLPQGLATFATEHHKRMVEKHKAKLQEIQRARLAGLQAMADDLSKQSVTIEANANEEGHLYGSVGATEISAALKRINITVASDQVRLQGPLKELGLYTVKIHLGPGDRRRFEGLGRAGRWRRAGRRRRARQLSDGV